MNNRLLLISIVLQVWSGNELTMGLCNLPCRNWELSVFCLTSSEVRLVSGHLLCFRSSQVCFSGFTRAKLFFFSVRFSITSKHVSSPKALFVWVRGGRLMRSREDALHLKWHSLFFWRITPSSAPAFNHAGEFDTFPNFITVSESKYNHRKSFRSSWRRVYKQLPCAPGEVVNLSSNFTATSEVNRGSNPRHPGAAQSCSSLYRVHHSPLQCS